MSEQGEIEETIVLEDDELIVMKTHSHRKRSTKKECPAELDSNIEIFQNSATPLLRKRCSFGDLKNSFSDDTFPKPLSIPTARNKELPKQRKASRRMSRGLSSPQLSKRAIIPKPNEDTETKEGSLLHSTPFRTATSMARKPIHSIRRRGLSITNNRMIIHAPATNNANHHHPKRRKKLRHPTVPVGKKEILGFDTSIISPKKNAAQVYDTRYKFKEDIDSPNTKGGMIHTQVPAVQSFSRTVGLNSSIVHSARLQISEEHFKRYRIIQELRDTERSYVTCLHMISVIFIQPIRNRINTPQQILSAKELKGIFGNIEEVCKFSQKILEAIEVIIHPSAWTDQSTIGDLFNDLLDGKEMSIVYHEYVDTYEKALSKIKDEFKIEDSPFKQFAQECQEKCDNHSLSSLLVVPVQRIPRYQLLLEDLIKATPRNHRDIPLLVVAHKKMVTLATALNESKWREESQEKMAELSRMLKKGFHENLNVKGRELLAQVCF